MGPHYPGFRGETPLTLGWNLSLLRSETDSIARLLIYLKTISVLGNGQTSDFRA
jgi:hypothetical protein